MSAIFAAANQVLAEVGKTLGRPATETDELLDWSHRSSQAVSATWDPELDLALDQDVHSGPIRVETCAGLSPVLLPNLDPEFSDRFVKRLFGPGFAGADGLAYPVVPSTAPGSAGFKPRSYWRGPTWPVFNWLMWWGLQRHGFHDEAAALSDAALSLLQAPRRAVRGIFRAVHRRTPRLARPVVDRRRRAQLAVRTVRRR